MKKIIYLLAGVVVTTLIALSFSGCIDQTFKDIEPRVDSTSIVKNTTIAELKSVYDGGLLKLTSTTFSGRDSIIIEGIVTSDDQAGNFYKTIVIEDATGGIEVKLEKTTLYNDYKRGQRVVIYCNDLFLGNYGGLIQIGSTFTENGYQQIGGIEGDILINKHVFKKGGTLVPVTPLVIHVNTLTYSNLSKLVKVEDVQFKTLYYPGTPSLLTYADKTGGESVDHVLKGCSEIFQRVAGGVNYDILVVRTSGFAKFANTPIADKKGSVTGILSYYNGTFQILVRDLNDINFTQTRCP